MTSKVLITGSADGLGREAARQLVRVGHEVILHARDEARAQQALAGVPGAAVPQFTADHRPCRACAGTSRHGANRDRTGDLLLAKQALSQLSYGPLRPEFTGRFEELVPPSTGRVWSWHRDPGR
jgi:NAD(P)-dependent dehydrogenase (short-subunit alcohol dehydrogenase family)